MWREITSGQRGTNRPLRCPRIDGIKSLGPCSNPQQHRWVVSRSYGRWTIDDKNDDKNDDLPPKNWPFSQAIQGQPGLKKPAALHQQPAAPPPTEERPAHGLVSGVHCGESGVETRLTQSLVMSWERKSPENLGMPFLIIESG